MKERKCQGKNDRRSSIVLNMRFLEMILS